MISEELANQRIEIARQLFKAWSSGDADAPERYLRPDAVLYDIVGGRKEGWPKIRAFFAAGLEHWKDLVLAPEEYWVNDKGVALSWVMTATVPDDRFGPQHKGKVWRSEGMTFLHFDGDQVAYEVDYHHGPNVMLSLEAQG